MPSATNSSGRRIRVSTSRLTGSARDRCRNDGSIGAIMASLICSASRGAGGPNHGMQPTAHCAAADAGRSATAGRGIAPSTGRSTRLHGGRSVQAPSPWAPALLLLSRSPVAFESARLRHATTTCSSHPPFSPLNTNLMFNHFAILGGRSWKSSDAGLTRSRRPRSRGPLRIPRS